mmetsp:Transcript_9329/g.8146  ORF Transcript_9329/g.8146 Transcript_9329/m.8146 type:complete len:120 (-) Transcript_9329:246-605(-)
MGDWLIFGKTKQTVVLENENPQKLSFNLIPLNVGELPLPKLTINPKRIRMGSPTKVSGPSKKARLSISVGESSASNDEDDAVKNYKTKVVYKNSQNIQIFNNQSIKGESFCFIEPNESN